MNLRRCGKSAQTETTSRRSRFESATTGATMGFMRGRLNAQGQILTGAHAAHRANRSEEHTSELQSLMRISYAVFCLKKKKTDSMKSRPERLTRMSYTAKKN